MVYTVKISDGCPATGNDIACNLSHASFHNSITPSAADRADESMEIYKGYQDNMVAFKAAKEASLAQARSDPKRWLSNDDLD